MAATSPKIKLHYFNAKGRAELIRIIFKLAHVEFEDIRYTDQDWATAKPKAPYGVLPYVEIDGKTLAGSLAIARYFGEKYGFAGKDDLENARLLAASDFMSDIFYKAIQIVFTSGEVEKENLLKAFKEQLPSKLNFLSNKIENSCVEGIKGVRGFNWSDLSITGMIVLIKKICPEILNESYDKLKEVHDKVIGYQEVKDWLASRPATDF